MIEMMKIFIKKLKIFFLWIILLPICSFGIFYSLTSGGIMGLIGFLSCIIISIILVQKIDDLKDSLKEDRDEK